MSSDPIRILIVDDSRIFRSALEDALKEHAGVRVVGSVWSGEKAMDFIRASPPDLVTLDLNMPGRGGLETLSDIRDFNVSHPDAPPIGVLLVSALTERGAAVTVEGLSRGAFDFIRKPDGPDDQANAAILRQQLVERVELFRHRRQLRQVAAASLPRKPVAVTPKVSISRFRAVAIGASTGGPEALAVVLPHLTRRTSVPIFVVQHLPSGMTHYFADSLCRKCSYHVVEAADGMLVEARTAYVAPGGRHMIVRMEGGRVYTALNDLPPENGCRPSVDVFFRSLGEVYPRSVVAVVLTGMGNDGAKSLGPLKRHGAFVIAQDENTSVVWGMPGAAVATQQVDVVLPLEAIGPTIASLLEGGISP